MQKHIDKNILFSTLDAYKLKQRETKMMTFQI